MKLFKMENDTLNKQEQRLTYLDIARGLAMIMVFVQHLYLPRLFVNLYVSSFSMQLFFIITGCIIFYKRKEKYDLKKEIIKRIKSLMIPYVFLELIYDFCVLYQGGVSNFLIAIKCAITLTPWGAMWFLPAICVAEIIFLFMLEKVKNNKLIGFNIIALYIVGMILPKIGVNLLIIFISRMLIALGFIYIGYLSFNFINKVNMKTVYIIMLMVVFGYLTKFNGVTSLYGLSYSNEFAYTFLAIINSILWILLSKKLQNLKISKAITYIGTNTIIIMGTHQKIIELITSKIIKGYQYNSYFPGIMNMILIMIIEIPIIEFINRKIPILAGKRKEPKTLLIESANESI